MVAKSDQLSTPFVSLEGGDGLLRGNPTAPLTARREPFELSSAAQARASACALLRKGLKAFSTSGSCFTGTGPTIRKVPSVITATPRLRGTGSRPLPRRAQVEEQVRHHGHAQALTVAQVRGHNLPTQAPPVRHGRSGHLVSAQMA